MRELVIVSIIVLSISFVTSYAELDLTNSWTYTVSDTINDIAVSDNSLYVAVITDYKLYILDYKGKVLGQFDIVEYHPKGVAVSSDGLVAVAGHYLYLYDSHGLLWKTQQNEDDKRNFEGVDITPDGNYIVASDTHYTDPSNLATFDKTGGIIAVGNIGDKEFESMATSSDATSTVMAWGNELFVFDRNGGLKYSFQMDEPHWGYENPVAISNDGNYIVSASSWSALVHLFDSERKLWSAKAEGDKIESVSYCDDYVLAITNTGKLYFFDKVDGTVLYTVDYNSEYGDSMMISNQNCKAIVAVDGGKITFVQMLDSATFKIESKPTQVRVLVDNDFKGESPITLSMKLGEHVILLRTDGYQEYKQKIKVLNQDDERCKNTQEINYCVGNRYTLNIELVPIATEEKEPETIIKIQPQVQESNTEQGNPKIVQKGENPSQVITTSDSPIVIIGVIATVVSAIATLIGLRYRKK